ncbi:MAG: Hypothetical protein PA2244 (similar to DNA topoisomerase IB, but possibly involved in glycosyl-transfer) [uncultured Thermomicrobiales bacterium]|uniref:DNA topoisomerase n=1 Tax=uncultured Thermomicrobiales bacterium TaxID=1645740 RepID=A0A6J4V327_9BACT|nr:MAG: Hypothetical protein PA2244 (similar to DNA topoisomerase IB, but possibly involved in glycosyl-transfer) [uncultured Thermomicrobiales bacterium]
MRRDRRGDKNLTQDRNRDRVRQLMPIRRLQVGRAKAAEADPVLAAADAGLRYTPDGGAGISRRKAGKGWSYRGPDGEPVRDEATLARIRSLAIPPAYKEVWINPDPLGHIQATGRDLKGRKQYRYHPRWNEARGETKFGRMISFGEALPALRARIEADLKRHGMPREKTLATVVRLLDESLIRVGNAEYARANESFGLTTLRDDHVEVEGATIHFSFRGKSGKEHRIDVKDRQLAVLVRRMQDLPGETLFQYVDHDGVQRTIGSEDVNAYLREIAGEEFTAKDFRTWAGTAIAARALRTAEPAETATRRKANTLAAIDRVAARLGNTRAVSRSSYVHPAVLAGYEDGTLLAFEPGPTGEGPEGLDEDERWVLAYLKDRAEVSLAQAA